ncbi:hypothetical protein [Mangrovicoccus ximenensis]|uniref:hypothetical protein n=1 Tax=Mangrovicoccus ximenensis TaxID=1911570 RepID=UPI000D3AF8F6|nr:hypothetical protein [Mangrovicoccus ximenensis]
MQSLLGHLALALGGRPVQALGRRLLLCVSKDAFLRSLGTPEPHETTEPRVIGIDDRACRMRRMRAKLSCWQCREACP